MFYSKIEHSKIIQVEKGNHMKKTSEINLHHYTTLESFASILKHRTIRFSSLSTLDDLTEGSNSSNFNLQHNVYISSWTDSDEESISMWKEYSDLNSGIRITMKKNPIKRHAIEKIYQDGTFIEGIPIHIKYNGFYTWQPIDKLAKTPYTFIDFFAKNDILHKVVYTNEKEKLFPSVCENNHNGTSLLFEPLGKCKEISWEYQREWRYIIHVFPRPISWSLENEDVQKLFKDLKTMEKPIVDFIDLTIEDEIFSEMSIIVSPNFSDGNLIILKALIEKYNRGVVIRDSNLRGKIRDNR